MADTLTTYYSFTKIEVGSSAETWGGKINANMDAVDLRIYQVSQVALAACAKAANLSDVANPATARANLGLAIGTNVQAHSTKLQALADLGWADNYVPYFTGAGSVALTGLPAYGRSLIASGDAGTARNTLGLGSGAVANYDTAASGSTLVQRNVNGDITTRYFLGTYVNTTDNALSSGVTAVMVKAGDDYHRSSDATGVRGFLSIGNVENKSSATIRSEITSGNVSGALGFAPTKITYGTAAPGALAVGEVYLQHVA